MNLTVSEKKEEPLLSRTLVNAEAVFEQATPSNKEVKAKLVSALNSDEKLVVVKHIYASFGNRKAKVIAYVYNNEKDIKRIEPEEKKEEKPKEAKDEEPKKREAKPEAEEKPREEPKAPKEEPKKPEAKKEAKPAKPKEEVKK